MFQLIVSTYAYYQYIIQPTRLYEWYWSVLWITFVAYTILEYAFHFISVTMEIWKNILIFFSRYNCYLLQLPTHSIYYRWYRECLRLFSDYHVTEAVLLLWRSYSLHEHEWYQNFLHVRVYHEWKLPTPAIQLVCKYHFCSLISISNEIKQCSSLIVL